MRRAALAQGGEAAVARQHERGRLTIRERIDGLVDASSFREIGALAGSAERDDTGTVREFTPANFVLGTGRIDGRICVVGGEDFTISGGSPSPAGLRKSIYTEELACQYRVPLVRLHEGAGGSITGRRRQVRAARAAGARSTIRPASPRWVVRLRACRSPPPHSARSPGCLLCGSFRRITVSWPDTPRR